MKELNKLIIEIKRETEQYLYKTSKIVKYVYRKRKKFPTLAAILLINKNINTCQIIGQLLDEKNQEEATVLTRFVLERIALAFKISKDNINIEYIDKLQANKCISELKKSFTFLGLLYGFLSDITHSHFWSFWLNFTEINKSKNKPKIHIVLYKSKKELSSAYLMLFTLVFLNLAVAEFIAKEDSKDYLFIWKLDKNLVWNCDIIDKLILWKVNNWFGFIDGKPLFN